MQQSAYAKKLGRFIRTLSLFKVPLLGLCRPQVIECSETRAIVELPHEFLTKNHLGSMYFGALAMGAELSIALKLLARMRDEKLPISFIFKDFKCEFHKRAEENVRFITQEAHLVSALIDRALSSGQRENGTFQGKAYGVKNPDEPLMSYSLTISVKRREK